MFRKFELFLTLYKIGEPLTRIDYVELRNTTGKSRRTNLD